MVGFSCGYLLPSTQLRVRIYFEYLWRVENICAVFVCKLTICGLAAMPCIVFCCCLQISSKSSLYGEGELSSGEIEAESDRHKDLERVKSETEMEQD